MNDIFEQIRNVGLMPVIKLTDTSKAVDLAKALTKGGIPVAEVTFRAAGAEKAIAAIAKEMPEMLVGAGTVLNVEQAKLAIDNGAKYIVAPGFVEEVVSYCLDRNVPVIPGCTNASEVSKASNMGLKVVKFFPAEAMGGLKVLKALAGPFSNMKFIPTGGINPDNLGDYLAFPKIVACGGSWMVPQKMVDESDWDGITALAQQAVTAMLNISVEHIGINSENENAALAAADGFNNILSCGTRETSVSHFVGSSLEIMKSAGRGTCGHIALGVSDVPRAVRFFTSQGFEFDNSSIKTDDNGRVKFIYFKDEIGGFAVHLVNSH